MKKILLVIIAFFLSSCSSNKEPFNLLKQNSLKYHNLKNTKRLIDSNYIVYATKEQNYILIKFLNRNYEQDIQLNSCLIDNKKTKLKKIENEIFDEYKIEATKEHLNLSCILSNQEKFNFSF